MAKTKKEIPEILSEGLDLYLQEGCEQAVHFWARGSAQHGHADLEDKVKSLNEVERAHGKFIGYKVEDTQVITPAIHLIFLRFNYERSDLAARFLAYKQGQGWILAQFLFDISLRTAKPFLV